MTHHIWIKQDYQWWAWMKCEIWTRRCIRGYGEMYKMTRINISSFGWFKRSKSLIYNLHSGHSSRLNNRKPPGIKLKQTIKCTINVRAQSVLFCSKLSVPHTKLSIAEEDLKYSAYRPLLWCFLWENTTLDLS